MIDVVCFGLGPIGARIAQRVLARPGLRLAGAVDTDPTKIGRDAGEVTGTQPARLSVVGDLNELPVPEKAAGAGAVAVHATSSSLGAVASQIIALCERGFNVVSTCEELSWPFEQAQLAEQIDASARLTGVSVIGSGINPGFLMDVLPLTLTAVCAAVRAVTVRRVVDTNARRLPLQRKTGVALTVEQFRARGAAGTLGHVGLRQSAAMLADGLGWQIDGYDESLEPVIAEQPTATGLGPVPAGGCIGQRQVAVARCGGTGVIRYELKMSAGATPLDEILIDGDPPLHQRIEGGVNGDVGTEAIIVNLIPLISAAAPGLLTMRDLLPLSAGR